MATAAAASAAKIVNGASTRQQYKTETIEMWMVIEKLALDCNNNKIYIVRNEEKEKSKNKIHTKNAVCICPVHHKLSHLMYQNNRFIVPLSAFFLFLSHTYNVSDKLSMSNFK